MSMWTDAILDALSFRTGHYHISYLSEATAVAGGFGIDMQVSLPQHVEIPRSLTEVVKAWNISMHNWLKKCKL